MKKRPFEAKDFLKFKFVYNPQISPCAKKVLYVKSSMKNDKYLSNIWLYDVQTASNIQFTYGNADSNGKWAPCGKIIAFNSSRKDRSMIYTISSNGGEAQCIVDFRYGVKELIWSPCGQKIAFIAPMYVEQTVADLQNCTKDENDKLIQAQRKIANRITKSFYKSNGYPGSGLVDEKVDHVFIIDLKTNKVEQLTSGNYSVSSIKWSPDGESILFSTNMVEDIGESLFDTDLWLVNTLTKNLIRITNCQGPVSNPIFSKNGKHVAYIGHELEYYTATNMTIYIVDIETLEKKDILEDFDYNVGLIHTADMTLKTSIEGPIWSECGQYIYFTYAKHGNNHLAKVDIKTGEIIAITKGNMQINGYSINTIKYKAAIQFSNSGQPGEIALVDLITGKLNQITNANTELLRNHYVAKPEEFWYKGNDNWDIQGWLLKPINYTEDKKFPLILEIHGGPHVMYSPLFFYEFQLLASAGYCVMFVNPRGSNGYGQKFTISNFNDFGGGDYKDLMKAIDYAQTLPFVDHKRLGVTGGSYGGYMTSWIISQTNRFKAAVAQRGVYNWVSFSGVSDCGCYFCEAEFGYKPWENISKLWDMSTLKYVESINTPLLIIHAESDIRSCIEQADQLYAFLKALKRKVEFLRFPNESHELSRSGQPNRRVARLEAIIDWFDRCL